jgi:hypothetical protein
VKGWPILGNIPDIMKDIKAENGGEATLVSRLQSKLGPLFKMRMLGEYFLLPDSYKVARCTSEVLWV